MKHILENSGYEYWKDESDRLHREDGGPSCIYSTGSEYWDKNGYLHRDKNPAHVSIDGYERWFKNGKFINETYNK